MASVYKLNYTAADINKKLDEIDEINNKLDQIGELEAESVKITYNFSGIPLKSISHRGWHEAPENTLPAFRESAERNFLFVECDVCFTKDDVPVLLHDANINTTARNKDGSELTTTINIANINYADLAQYDFGIYAGAKYAGTPIPTLEEFIILCRDLNLFPYIEIKPQGKKPFTIERATTVLNIVNKYGMQLSVSYVSSDYSRLSTLVSLEKTARVGLISSRSITTDIIEQIAELGLDTGINEVFFSIAKSQVTEDLFSIALEHNWDVEVYGQNSADGVLATDKRITGITSDMINAADILRSANLRIAESSVDILSGKKWAVFGDSFTGGNNIGNLTEGRYTGNPKTYPYLIGNRTGIEVLRFFQGGRTMAYPADGTITNSATCPECDGFYQNVPADVDYITLYIGSNDSFYATKETGQIPLGNITDMDTSTYYGAWNTVLTWIRENRPFAHIGIIVSNAASGVAYRNAQIEIARRHGIPFIDMNGDDRTPVMVRSVNPDILDSVKDMINKKQAVDYDGTKTGTVNFHPNEYAHEYESTFIENFLRSL